MILQIPPSLCVISELAGLTRPYSKGHQNQLLTVSQSMECSLLCCCSSDWVKFTHRADHQRFYPDTVTQGHRWGLSSKAPACNAGAAGDAGSIPGSGRSPGGGHGHSLQYSCLENPTDKGASWATVHGVARSRTQLKQLSTRACIVTCEKGVPEPLGSP